VLALVFLEKLVCFVRSEVVVSEDMRFKPASGKETENAFEIIEEMYFRCKSSRGSRRDICMLVIWLHVGDVGAVERVVETVLSLG
jgi:hypothetical protein